MDDIKKEFKAYFEDEVASKHTPPMQMPEPVSGKKRGKVWENLFLAACILGSLALFTQPSIYDTQLRRMHLPMNKYEAFKEEVPRVLFEGIQYMKNRKGVMND
ncbi:MAG: hypothetical protein JXR86_16660 [Spirochaetales bacterium]|nr:hypothetical protein [Spirochaetales bacterium]